jgi:hypothetical protein
MSFESACWKYDDKTKRYICKEKECESFYRMVELPEEIKTDEAEAELKDGILEVALPKKAPKHKKAVNAKQNRDGNVVKNPHSFETGFRQIFYIRHVHLKDQRR